MEKGKYILSIETSCDETAAAVIFSDNKSAKILSNVVSSQIKIHKSYGGVVPEIASRAHLEKIKQVVQKALKDAKLKLGKIDYFAVTKEPGLIGSLLVGIYFTKSLSWTEKKPLLEINHIDGHFFAAFTEKNTMIFKNIDFPIISLIVSGGHTSLMLANSFKKIKIIGETQDDAAGESFDKAAKILGLDYPGGPAISKITENIKTPNGKEQKTIALPRPMINSNNFNFSFSGLKTALLYKIEDLEKTKKLTKRIKNLLAWEFQNAAVESLVFKTIKAAKKYQPKTISVSGGVAANKLLRQALQKEIRKNLVQTKFQVPSFDLCTDNAAMIGITAAIKLNQNLKKDIIKSN